MAEPFPDLRRDPGGFGSAREPQKSQSAVSTEFHMHGSPNKNPAILYGGARSRGKSLTGSRSCSVARGISTLFEVAATSFAADDPWSTILPSPKTGTDFSSFGSCANNAQCALGLRLHDSARRKLARLSRSARVSYWTLPQAHSSCESPPCRPTSDCRADSRSGRAWGPQADDPSAAACIPGPSETGTARQMPEREAATVRSLPTPG